MTGSTITNPLLNVQGLRTQFFTMEGVVKAVDGVDIAVDPGQTFGVVGESGCGKSMTALSVLRLVPSPQGRIVSGRIDFHDQDLLQLPEPRMRQVRGAHIAMIFQEPMTGLNPVFTIGRQIAEAIIAHRAGSKRAAWSEAVSLLNRVGIPAPKQRAKDFPHQLSGGMRQRAMIAMAMACRPELLIADEPTTALDVTIQAQILDLIQELKDELGMAVLLITHNFGIIAETAVRTAVMYAGKVVEEADTVDLFSAPAHPYTKGLLHSLPRMGLKARRGRRKLHEIPGIVPKLTEDRIGCPFMPRCQQRLDKCAAREPDMITLNSGHRVRCWPELVG